MEEKQKQQRRGPQHYITLSFFLHSSLITHCSSRAFKFSFTHTLTRSLSLPPIYFSKFSFSLCLSYKLQNSFSDLERQFHEPRGESFQRIALALSSSSVAYSLWSFLNNSMSASPQFTLSQIYLCFFVLILVEIVGGVLDLTSMYSYLAISFSRLIWILLSVFVLFCFPFFVALFCLLFLFLFSKNEHFCVFFFVF